MSGINPRIIEHDIKNYPNAKPVQQCLHAVNPRKAPAIKAEIENLLKVGFYLSHSLDGVGFKPHSS